MPGCESSSPIRGERYTVGLEALGWIGTGFRYKDVVALVRVVGVNAALSPPHFSSTRLEMLADLLRSRTWSTISEGPDMTFESDTRRRDRRSAPPRGRGPSVVLLAPAEEEK